MKEPIDRYTDEHAGDGRPLYCHRYEDGYMDRHLTLDGDGLDVAYSDCDGDHCNITLDMGTIAELLRRAGWTVTAPLPAREGEG